LCFIARVIKDKRKNGFSKQVKLNFKQGKCTFDSATFLLRVLEKEFYEKLLYPTTIPWHK